jgi:hypothetical protein
MDEVDERTQELNGSLDTTFPVVFKTRTGENNLCFRRKPSAHPYRVASLVVTRYVLLATCYLLSLLDSVGLWHPGVAVDSRKSLIFCPVR